MLRGHAAATIDDKGRVKIPTPFRRFIEQNYGRELFVTSLNGDNVRVYPLSVWKEIENKIAEAPQLNPAVHRFVSYVNFFGQATSLDRQGRILIQPHLRKKADMTGEVAILGSGNHLQIWNRNNFEKKIESEPLTLEDQNLLSSLGI